MTNKRNAEYELSAKYMFLIHRCTMYTNALYTATIMLRICHSHHTVVSFVLKPMNLYVGFLSTCACAYTSSIHHMRYKYQHIEWHWFYRKNKQSGSIQWKSVKDYENCEYNWNCNTLPLDCNYNNNNNSCD